MPLYGSQIWKIIQIAPLQKLTISFHQFKKYCKSATVSVYELPLETKTWLGIFSTTVQHPPKPQQTHFFLTEPLITLFVVTVQCLFSSSSPNRTDVFLSSMISLTIPLGLRDLNLDYQTIIIPSATEDEYPFLPFFLAKISFSWSSFPLKNKVYLRLRGLCVNATTV